jgi:hypothetical protein
MALEWWSMFCKTAPYLKTNKTATINLIIKKSNVYMTEILKVWLVNYFHLCDSSGSHGGDYQDRFWNIPPCRPTQVGRRLRDAYWLNLLFLYHVSFTFHMSHSLHLRFFSLSFPPQPVPSVILLALNWSPIFVHVRYFFTSSGWLGHACIPNWLPCSLSFLAWSSPLSPLAWPRIYLVRPIQTSPLTFHARLAEALRIAHILYNKCTFCLYCIYVNHGTALVRTKTSNTWQTRPLVREGALRRQWK